MTDAILVTVQNPKSPHPAAWDRMVESMGWPRVVVHSHPGASSRAAWLLGIWNVRRRLSREVRSTPVMTLAHGGGLPALVALLVAPSLVGVIVYGSEVLNTSRVRRELVIRILRRTSIVVVTADEVRKQLCNSGVDHVYWAHPGINWTQARAEIHEVVVPKVVSLRRATEHYHGHEICDGFIAARSAEGDDLVRLVVPIGHVDEGPYVEALRRRAEAAEEIEVIESVLDHDDLIALYGGATVGVSLAATDQLSVSVLEGLAAGMVMVLTDLPAYRPFLDLPWVVTVPSRPTAADVTAALTSALTLTEVLGDSVEARQERALAAERVFRAEVPDSRGLADRLAALVADAPSRSRSFRTRQEPG